ncbi:hypothetical protein D3C85_440860 [compost metagenome]
MHFNDVLFLLVALDLGSIPVIQAAVWIRRAIELGAFGCHEAANPITPTRRWIVHALGIEQLVERPRRQWFELTGNVLAHGKRGAELRIANDFVLQRPESVEHRHHVLVAVPNSPRRRDAFVVALPPILLVIVVRRLVTCARCVDHNVGQRVAVIPTSNSRHTLDQLRHVKLLDLFERGICFTQADRLHRRRHVVMTNSLDDRFLNVTLVKVLIQVAPLLGVDLDLAVLHQLVDVDLVADCLGFRCVQTQTCGHCLDVLRRLQVRPALRHHDPANGLRVNLVVRAGFHAEQLMPLWIFRAALLLPLATQRHRERVVKLGELRAIDFFEKRDGHDASYK